MDTEIKELMRVYQENNVKSQERLEVSVSKLAEVVSAVNHNSDRTADAIEKMEKTFENMVKEDKAVSRKWAETAQLILKNGTYAGILITLAYFGIKGGM